MLVSMPAGTEHTMNASLWQPQLATRHEAMQKEFVRVQAWLCLIGPRQGQPTSLGLLGWSMMFLDGLVHPQKID